MTKYTICSHFQTTIEVRTAHGFNQATAEVARRMSTSFLSFSLGGVPLKPPYLMGLGT